MWLNLKTLRSGYTWRIMCECEAYKCLQKKAVLRCEPESSNMSGRCLLNFIGCIIGEVKHEFCTTCINGTTIDIDIKCLKIFIKGCRKTRLYIIIQHDILYWAL